MKRILFTLLLSVVTLGIYAADTDSVAWFTVEPPMTCSNCENKIKSNLRFEKGIKEINPSAADAIVSVTYNPAKTDVAKIIAGFKKIGYTATAVAEPVESGMSAVSAPVAAKARSAAKSACRAREACDKARKSCKAGECKKASGCSSESTCKSSGSCKKAGECGKAVTVTECAEEASETTQK